MAVATKKQTDQIENEAHNEPGDFAGNSVHVYHFLMQAGRGLPRSDLREGKNPRLLLGNCFKTSSEVLKQFLIAPPVARHK